MPLPLLLGLGAAAIGIGGHLSAKETNEKAQELADEAKEMYDSAKESLDREQFRSKSALSSLGYQKKEVLEGTVQRFLKSYERIKNVELKDTAGLEEIKKFSINPHEALELREMADIYEKALSSGAAGAVTGAAVALAANGTLGLMTGELAAAGSALLAGNIGVATSLAGGALSFGAAMTPLAAIAAPVVLFTGISSSIKADENLEKAQTMYAEAELAVEKMKISETLCIAISERSEMFERLIKKLDRPFLECTIMLESLVHKKTGVFKGKIVDAQKLTQEEMELIAVTRSLAGAIKAVLDTPILNANGNLAEESEEMYEKMQRTLPQLEISVNRVKSYKYGKNIDVQKSDSKIQVKDRETQKSGKLVSFISWFLSIWFAISGISVFAYGAIVSGIIWMIGPLIMCPRITRNMKFRFRLLCLFLMTVVSTILMTLP